MNIKLIFIFLLFPAFLFSQNCRSCASKKKAMQATTVANCTPEQCKKLCPNCEDCHEKSDTLFTLNVINEFTVKNSIWVGATEILVSNLADYFYQADNHGWVNPLWVNGTRSPKWGIFDFIPHDGYHIAQSTTHFFLVTGNLLAWESIDAPWYYKIVALMALNIIGRGLGFSLPYYSLNKW